MDHRQETYQGLGPASFAAHVYRQGTPIASAKRRQQFVSVIARPPYALNSKSGDAARRLQRLESRCGIEQRIPPCVPTRSEKTNCSHRRKDGAPSRSGATQAVLILSPQKPAEQVPPFATRFLKIHHGIVRYGSGFCVERGAGSRSGV